MAPTTAMLALISAAALLLGGSSVAGVQAPSASAATSLSLLQTPNAGSLDPYIMVADPKPAREECKVKNLKQQERMNMAILDAHRCLARDTVVAVPLPNDVIVNFIQPTHVVVQRCTGLCLESPGCDCQPKKVRDKVVDVIIGTNSSSTSLLCTKVKIEEHRPPCRCKCNIQTCHYNKNFDEAACACRCKAEFAPVKAQCASDFEREWHEDTCACKCIPRVCVTGYYQDRTTCQCKPVETTCSAIAGTGASMGSSVNSSDRVNTHAPKYIGLACVAIIALAMLLSIYYLMVKRGAGPGLHHSGTRPDLGVPGLPSTLGSVHHLGGSGSTTAETVVGTLQRATGANGRPTAAYTITINSQGSAGVDESILPLTEDKTRF